MQQSSATPQNQRCREGVAEDCCILSLLLAVPSCIYSFWHGVIPTSYFIFYDFYTCSIIHVSPSVYTKLPSCIYSFWHGVIPTSYFIFKDFYTCKQSETKLLIYITQSQEIKQNIFSLSLRVHGCTHDGLGMMLLSESR